MSITDELRNWMENAFTYKTVDGDMFHKVNTPWFGWKRDIEEMLDLIDAEHESKVSYWQGASYRDGYDEGFASADDYFTDKRKTLEEHGWVKLPVDADGVPIRVGDVLDCDANGYKGTFSVFAVGDNVVVGNHPEELWHKRPMDTFHVARFCHHHVPTVEDVLREFASDIADVLGGDDFRLEDNDELFAEYAAKLRLAEEDE